MSIDTVLNKYTNMYEELRGHLQTVQNGEIPHGNTEGAPTSLAEAEQAILGMTFIVNMVMNDLLEIAFEDVYQDAQS